jgi:hypothetical protein
MKRWIVMALLAGAAAPAFGQEPPLGRLFLTPDQRAALDNARRNRIRAEALAATAEKKPKIPLSRTVTINGVVNRSDGESTVWINGHPTDGETADGMRVVVTPGSDSSVVLREPEKGRQIRLKVGQRADVLSGRIEESYDRPSAVVPLPSSETAAPEEPSITKAKKQQDAKSLRASREREREDREREDRAREDAAHEAAPAAEEKPAQ